MKMNIIMITPSFYPQIGGVEKHIMNISLNLVKLKHKVIIISEKRNKTSPDYEIYKGIEIYRVNGRIPLLFFLIKNIRLLLNADVIQIHDFVSFRRYFPLKLILFRKPIYITFHGFDKIPIPKHAIIFRKIAEILSTDHICVGKYIRKYYGTRCNHIIYGGVEESGIKPTEEIDLVFIGRLEPDMDVDIYLKSIKYLKENYDMKINLHIIGDGTLRSEIEKFSDENGLRIKILGKLANPIPIMAKAKVILANGYLSILEAAILRKPIIAAYNSELKYDYLTAMSMKELIILKDYKNIASEIRDLLLDPTLRKQIGNENYKYANKQSWKNIVNLYLKMYQKHIKK